MESEKIISLSFSKDHTRFACCTTTSVRIFKVEPLLNRELINTGGASSCTILSQHHMFGIIPSEKHSRYCGKTVLIYDYSLLRFVMEIACESGVQSVRTTRNKIIVVTMDKISVFTFPGAISHIVNLETCPNPLGLCEITPLDISTRQIIAYPGVLTGSIHIMNISDLGVRRFNAYEMIKAHSGEISCLAINQFGTNIASASNTESSIKIWDTYDKEKVVELIRSNRSKIYCINFSPNSEYLCSSNVEGTIEIFSVKKYNLMLLSIPLRYSSRLSTIKKFPKKSFVTFTVPPKEGCICTFRNPNILTAICLDGTHHTYAFSKCPIRRIGFPKYDFGRIDYQVYF